MKTLILFLIFQIYKSTTHFILNLEPYEKICLDEHFSDKTLIIYEINSNITSHVRIIDPTDKEVYEKYDILDHKLALTTHDGGYYETCIENQNNDDHARVEFSLKHGVAAKDYSSIAKYKDLKPLELDVYIIF